MKEKFLLLKQLFAGKWAGEGYAKFPTIHATAYEERLEFIADACKDAVHFNQKTWYKNKTGKNGQTVFWDTGFILLREDKIVLHSIQVGGRIEQLTLTAITANGFTFSSDAVLNDSKTTRSERIFSVFENNLHYELNMSTIEAAFQNHLKAHLKKIKSIIDENSN